MPLKLWLAKNVKLEIAVLMGKLGQLSLMDPDSDLEGILLLNA